MFKKSYNLFGNFRICSPPPPVANLLPKHPLPLQCWAIPDVGEVYQWEPHVWQPEGMTGGAKIERETIMKQNPPKHTWLHFFIGIKVE